MLSIASKIFQPPHKDCEIGTGGGSSTGDGEWNVREWLPSLVKSSLNMAAVPRELGSQDKVDWIPVDWAAGVVLDLVFSQNQSDVGEEAEVSHIVNPHTVS